MICTQSLSYSYPQRSTLTFADVDVPQGAVLLLSGPSCCGKSTWLALVAALVTPTAGTLTVAGQPLSALTLSRAKAARVVEVFTKTPLKYTMEPVVVEGRLTVLADDPYGLY